jgi:cell division protease FtsH
MVCDWGMSEKLGFLKFGKHNEQIFLGREISQHRDFSEATAQQIDEEIRTIISNCEKDAQILLSNNNEYFEKMAQYLIERETLNAEEILMIMKGEVLPPVVNGASLPEEDVLESEVKAEEEKPEQQA